MEEDTNATVPYHGIWYTTASVRLQLEANNATQCRHSWRRGSYPYYPRVHCLSISQCSVKHWLYTCTIFHSPFCLTHISWIYAVDSRLSGEISKGRHFFVHKVCQEEVYEGCWGYRMTKWWLTIRRSARWLRTIHIAEVRSCCFLWASLRGGGPFQTSPASLFPHKTDGNEDVSSHVGQLYGEPPGKCSTQHWK